MRIRCSDDERGNNNKKWFWEIFNEMNKQDRELCLKFMSGDSRLVPDRTYSIDYYDRSSPFPEGHTCGANMHMPYYTSKEQAQ